MYFFTAIFSHKNRSVSTQEPVSVIICARNNLAGLQKNLPHVLSQQHSNFEVIVVNDGSTDGTIGFLDDLQKSETKLKVLHLDIDERFHRGKKFAQTIGIKAAKHNFLLFTDTDCVPASEHWITEMAAGFESGKEIVIGVGNHFRSASPMNWLIQLETFHTVFMYINFALRNRTFMGVGRNLAYTRELFFRVKGFAKHQHILSGDDDLFVNETATGSNVSVCLSPDSFTNSDTKGGIMFWAKQKKRHFSTGKMYKGRDKFWLGLYIFSLFMFYVTLIGSLFFKMWLIPAICIYALRFIIQGVVLRRNMKVLNYLPYYFLYPLLDFGILFIHIFIGIRGYFSKPKAW